MDGISSSIATQRSIAGTNPAAGAEIQETVPSGKWWKLLALTVQLVQGITDTPQPILVIDDGANVIWEGFGSSAAQASGTTTRYTWSCGSGTITGQVGAGANVHSTAPLPAIPMGPGWRVRTSTLGITATGDYGVPRLFVVEYG